ncbi:MAG: serine dehydratase subunit alpha family protein [Bacteroidales bacterium]|nr:serine dehydratase subunit alpha family protein [Bacteroidales bacterium]
MNNSQILELLHSEVKPALGCTEPIALSLAVARACSLFPDRKPLSVRAFVSANIFKNGMGVGIPGTGMVGLDIAVALAVVAGKWERGLEVLKDSTPDDVARAKALLESGIIHVGLSDTTKKLYIIVTADFEGGHRAEVIIEDDHDRFTSVCKDGVQLLLPAKEAEEDTEAPSLLNSADYDLDIRAIHNFAVTAPLEDISFILEAAELNKALAREGLTHKYGLQVGRTLSINDHDHLTYFGQSLISRCMALTAAASDARMAGSMLPAMSNSGSGNQGITVTMPVVAAAEHVLATTEQLTRALILAHLTAIHIKHYLGKLSALCGCVIASTGAACGIVYLHGGDYEQITFAIKNMVANITGMVCDGAKEGCALKVASGVSSAVQSAVLALDGICVSEKDGIIDLDIEKTIRNLGVIGSRGMQTADDMILEIMRCK